VTHGVEWPDEKVSLMSQSPVLVTGAAGFIGFALARRLLEGGCAVVGVDSVNDYYDPALKEARLAVLRQFKSFTFHKFDLADRASVETLFRDGDFGPVVHLAAQAGVRYSLQNPHAYLDANLAGFLNVLEGCRHRKTGHLVFASSSSVYGANTRLPFSVHDNVDHPISLYAATKKANELMAHAYSHLYGLPATGLRFFTVYGPWGRPDMAMFIFAKAIAEGKPIRLFNYGRMRRDFTYVDDVVEALERVIDKVPVKAEAASINELDPGSSAAPWRIYNIGNNRTVKILRVVELLEQEFGHKAKTELVSMQPGDVPETCADVDDLMRDVGFRPATPIEQGIRSFAAWYREYHAH
jgi:UDP-glucuronate 4-epimerase